MIKKTKFIHVDDGGYTVGYGKPPKATQFRKGETGNSKGRPPRTAYEEDDFPVRKFMMEPMSVKLDGKKQNITRLDALLIKLFGQAINGNVASIRLLIHSTGGLKDFREEWKRVKTQADLDCIEDVAREAEKWFPEKPKRKN
jgi:hypothetical protein